MITLALLAGGVFYRDEVDVTPWANTYDQQEVAAYVYGNKVVVAWVYPRYGNLHEILVAVSKDGGNTFNLILEVKGQTGCSLQMVDPFVFRDDATGDWFVGGLARDNLSSINATEIFLLRCPAGRDVSDPNAWEILGTDGYVGYDSWFSVKDRPIGFGHGGRLGVVFLRRVEGNLYPRVLVSYDRGNSWPAEYEIVPWNSAFPWAVYDDGFYYVSFARRTSSLTRPISRPPLIAS